MIITLVGIIFIICLISVIFCHYNIKIEKYNIKSEKILNEIKLVHLSDLHSRIFSKDNNKFVLSIVKQSPDIIVMTGDMLNGKYNDIFSLDKLIKSIKSLTSCTIYYIMGNREFRYNKENYIKLKEMLKNNNVVVLENATDEILVYNSKVCIHGLNYCNRDADSYYDKLVNGECINTREIRKDIISFESKLDTSKYNILLVHDPKDFEKYAHQGFDLVLAGHIHGGVIRIPFIGGLLSPEFKFFPKYDRGLYKNGKSIMCVSSGLGYGTIPFRLFNRPEILYISLDNNKL